MRHPVIVGSIPACAGEPRGKSVCTRLAAVYPRVCGGTRVCDKVDTSGGGLSPRVRGNPVTTYQVAGAVGSIPACAGEPCGGR